MTKHHGSHARMGAMDVCPFVPVAGVTMADCVALARECGRRIGELGIGCNPGITRFMRNTLFDEKIGGTVHIALGQSYTDLGGNNESGIHWDIVKDLRVPGSRIELDGVVVQSDGIWQE